VDRTELSATVQSELGGIAVTNAVQNASAVSLKAWRRNPNEN
jgi:hypothetical protein